MTSKRVAVLAVISAGGEKGGAERFYDGLTEALCRAGIDAMQLGIVSDESCFEAILESYLRFYDLDLHAFDGVISTKAPAYLVRHPNHVCYLQHTMRVFYDMYDVEYPQPDVQRERQRRLIQQLDSAALNYPHTRKIFVIGHEVRRRLLRYNHLPSEVLHQALSFDKFRPGPHGDYFLLPGRLHRWKRVDLAIAAMRYVKGPLRLVITGTGEDQGRFQQLAAGDNRIEFVGRVSDQRLVDLYGGACGVLFVPLREDFGLVTLEAFAARKPVITCGDSGEPARLVEDGVSGFVCAADPRRIAWRMEYLYRHRRCAEMMGRAGYRAVQAFSWQRVARRLIESLGFAVDDRAGRDRPDRKEG